MAGMSEEHKRAGTSYWVAVALLTVLVGYPLSFGPACWTLTLLGDPDWAVDAYRLIYAPILWTYDNGPRRFHEAIDRYCQLLP
jgi:hypothetical protein